MNIQLIKHIGEQCPVPPDAMVMYRTTSIITPLSHIHMPMKAIDLDWTKRPSVGRILEYRVVKLGNRKTLYKST